MVGAVRQQAITWANVDPDFCHHMVSLHHNELNSYLSEVQNLQKVLLFSLLCPMEYHATLNCSITMELIYTDLLYEWMSATDTESLHSFPLQ